MTRRGAGIGGRTRWRSRARATSLNLPPWPIASTYSSHGAVGRTPPRPPCPPTLWNLLEACASERVPDTLLKVGRLPSLNYARFF